MTQETPQTPPTWLDYRLAEVCARQATLPSAFGMHAAAWRVASVSFMEAHRAATGENGRGPEHAAEMRKAGFKALHDHGLRVEQAIAGHHADDPVVAAPTVVPTAQQMKAQRIAEYTARLLYLRSAADTATAHLAERASVQYGAAGCYERAVTEWNFNRPQAGEVWVSAAEQLLSDGVVPAPWHQQLPASTPS